ncbi:MAG: voltage-gated potassium channel [Paracoccaceae bacterium]|jgi:voltage-gated potassium channel
MTLRRRAWMQLDPEGWAEDGISPVNRLILALVCLSILLSVLHTEPSLAAAWGWFQLGNAALGTVFVVELAARLWSKPEHAEFSDRFGRLRYALEWHSVLDMIAVVSIWIDVAGYGEDWFAVLRLARVFRIFWLSRHSNVGEAVSELWGAVRARSTELLVCAVVVALVLLLSSIALFMAEREIQPEAFGSIPRAMWWSICTLTTVGYGDVTPVTTFGKVLAGLTSLASIAVLALPAGIMAAAFSDAFQRTRARQKAKGPDA